MVGSHRLTDTMVDQIGQSSWLLQQMFRISHSGCCRPGCTLLSICSTRVPSGSRYFLIVSSVLRVWCSCWWSRRGICYRSSYSEWWCFRGVIARLGFWIVFWCTIFSSICSTVTGLFTHLLGRLIDRQFRVACRDSVESSFFLRVFWWNAAIHEILLILLRI